MAWRAYNTVNGQILGETSATGARPVDYQLDALGSVVGTIKANGTLENTYRYAGYGQQVSKTRLGSDPKFLWVGGWGCRISMSFQYIRARSYDGYCGRWLSIDLMWPGQPAFSYGESNPSTQLDPSGLYPYSIRQCKEYKLYQCLKSYLQNPYGGWESACRWCQDDSLWAWNDPNACAKMRAWYSKYKPPKPPPLCPRPISGHISDPMGWEYGFYCGSRNVRTEGGPYPQDCADKCCKEHDDCLARQYKAGLSEPCAHKCCNFDFRECLRLAQKSDCCFDKTSPMPKECCRAVDQMLWAFENVVVFLERRCKGKPRCV